jgi:tRNA nucleotidyltransferase/poly(A) polymerase
MEKFKLYKVGGCVRDTLLGLKSKDIDYSFIFEEIDTTITPDEYFIKMKNILESIGVEIFQLRPDCFTIRGRLNGESVDYVMGRKETYPNPESRIPLVEMGNLYEELRRRDFTVNAIAEDEDGNLIDPFNGVKDIKDKILKCPINAKTSFNDDPLRMLRALRFAITKGFKMSSEVSMVILADEDMWEKFSKVVSQERIREEVFKMFKHDTIEALDLLCTLQMNSPVNVMEKIFANGMWLKPTFENVK